MEDGTGQKAERGVIPPVLTNGSVIDVVGQANYESIPVGKRWNLN
jgi:hypothetical protein